MSQTTGSTLLLASAVAVAIGILWLGLNRPVGLEENSVLDFDASSPQQVVPPSDSYEQRFAAPQRPLRGISLYLPSALTPVQMSVVVANQRTGKSVRGYQTGMATRGDSQRLQFLLPYLASKPKDVLIAKITNRAAINLPLLTHDAHNLTFSVWHPVTPSFGFFAGLLAAGIFGMVLVIGEIVPRQERLPWWLVRCLTVGLPLFAVPGFWYSLGHLGVADWDYRFSLHEIYRRTIITFHQFPLWNPYTCGGTAGLADPEFSVLSPAFLLELVFGIGGGTKAGLYFGLAIVGLGMIQLAKALGLSWRAAGSSALITTYSSAFILKAVEGHITIIYAYMWIPWIFWAWLGAYRAAASPAHSFSPRYFLQLFYTKESRAGASAARKSELAAAGDSASNYQLPVIPPTGGTPPSAVASYQLLGGFFFALAFYQGGIYLLSYTVLALVVLCFFARHHRQAVAVSGTLLLWATGFSAFKLLPVLSWLRQYPDTHYVGSTGTLSYLSDIFMRRHAHGTYLLPGQLSGWHEYGAYIGFFIFGIALLALSQWRHSRLVRLLVVAALLCTLVATQGPLLQPFFDTIPFIPRSNISRLNLFTVIAISLLAGIGLDVLYRSGGARKILVHLAALLIAVDLLSYSASLSHQAFILPEVFSTPTPAPFPLAYSSEHYTIQKANQEHNRSYVATRAGYGSFSFCSVLGPKASVATVTADTVPPFATVGYDGSASLHLWSPNAFTVQVDAPSATQVVINMNYAPGWFANGSATRNYEGRLSADVPAGQSSVAFVYRPPLLRVGLVITITTLLLAFVYIKKSLRHA